MKISIIISAYNEEAKISSTLKTIIDYCQKNTEEYEIIVVDDGSKDNTLNIVNNIKKMEEGKSIVILQNEKNRGKGYSVRRGGLYANYDYVLFTDADLSTPIEELDKFKSMEEYDIIIGSRKLKDSKITIKQPFLRRILSWFFTVLVNLFFIKGIKDTQCGFKLFKRAVISEIFPKLTLDRFAFDIELLYLAEKKGYKIKEVPVVWADSEKSCVKIFTPLQMFFELIKIKINELRGVYKTAVKGRFIN